MASWRELVGYLGSNYKIDQPDTSTISLIFDQGNGRSQAVFIFGVLLDDPELAHAAFFSAFAKVDQISPQQLAAVLSDSNLLGIAKVGDYYGYMNVSLLANLDANEIEWPMTLVTDFADERERMLGLGDNL
jgi:hypothetical protein